MPNAPRYAALVDKSLQACSAAIEIYNKPDFRYREEAFSILMLNAWELLLKARVLNENRSFALRSRAALALSLKRSPAGWLRSTSAGGR